MECERDSTDPGLDDMGGGKRRRIETSDDHQDHGAGPSASLPVPNAEGTSEQDGSLNGHSDDAAAALESSDDEMEGRGVSEVIHRLKSQDANPVEVLVQLGLEREMIENLGYSEDRYWAIVHNVLLQMGVSSRPPPRDPITSIEVVSDMIRDARNVLILTGAGVSTSCGIPDFRSENGIYARLKTDYPTLPDPQSMFDMKYFKRDQKPFFDFAAEIWPGNFAPAPSHHFIRQVEAHGKLLRNYTQNIDTLEQEAGITRVIQCHGSFSTASCLVCKYQVPSATIEADVKAKRIPICCRAGTAECPMPPEEEDADTAGPATSFLRMPDSTSTAAPPTSAPTPSAQADAASAAGAAGAAAGLSSHDDMPAWLKSFLPKPEPPLRPVMKPDIVFFGQDLPEVFYDSLPRDTQTCDLVIVIGSSLKVSPVARIPTMVPASVPQILINREPLPHLEFNAELLGNCDAILEELSARLGWTISPATTNAIDTTTAPTVAPEALPAQPSGGSTNTAPLRPDGSTHTDEVDPDVENPQLSTNDENSGPSEHSGPRAGYIHGHHFLEPNRFAFPGAVLDYVPSDDEVDDVDADDSLTENGALGAMEVCPENTTETAEPSTAEATDRADGSILDPE